MVEVLERQHERRTGRLGLEETAAAKLRVTVPTDSAPQPFQLPVLPPLPDSLRPIPPPMDTLSDTLRVNPPPPTR